MDPTDLDGPRPKGPPSLVMPPPSLASAPSDELLPDIPSEELPRAVLPPVDPEINPPRDDGPPTAEPSPTLVPEPDAPKASSVDPKDLAKMLAKAAAARGKAPRSPAPEAPRNPTPMAAESRPTIGRLATAPPPGRTRPAADGVAEGSRLSAAPPPVRKKSASEVLDELARHPEPEPPAAVPPPVEATPRPAPKPATIRIPATNQGDSDWVAALLLQQLPMLAGATVAKVLLVEDREAQKALWKGHRARFLATGDVGHGLAVAAVLHALSQAPAGELAVARLVTGDRDWLVWVERRSCIAAFPNASLWFNGI